MKYKKIEKSEKKKKKNEIEENKGILNYEGFYVQEAERQIESIINVDVPNIGIKEITSKVIIKSTFNILKKDDINVETILNHNVSPMDERTLPAFTNMYHKMIRNEFQAHLDEITCITVVENLSCFITSSKDKFVKIFNYDCECLGVINCFPKLAKYDGEMPEWKFYIDEKKILEDEINEVVGIFEKVGVETIRVGSKTDIEVENIQVNEKMERRKFKKITVWNAKS